MSRRGLRLVSGVVVAAVVVAAVAVERMTPAAAQAGMRRAPARRVPLPTVPTRKLVTVKTGRSDPSDTADGAPQEPPGAAPAPLSRFALSSLLATEVGDVWLDLTPGRPYGPGKGHLRWYGPTKIVTNLDVMPDGYVRLYYELPALPARAKIHVRPQVPGARYLVDCSMQSDEPVSVSYRGSRQMIPVLEGHLLFVWDTSSPDPVQTEWNTELFITSTDNEWTFYRCQLTFLGGPE